MAAKEEPKVEEAPAKDKKKLFIIIGAAVAVVAIVAVVLMLTLKGGKEKEKANPAEAKEGKDKGVAAVAPVHVYPLEPFIVNIYDGQEIRYLKLKVEFGITAAEVKPELDARQAPLRDAILVLLTTKTMQDIQDLQGKNQLREEILTAVSKILPPGKVIKVFFTDFVVQ